MILHKEEIKSLIPHREPFLFLDKCEIIEKSSVSFYFLSRDLMLYF